MGQKLAGKARTPHWDGSTQDFGEMGLHALWAHSFFVIAIIAAFLGYGGVAASATDVAKLFFVGFLVLAILTAISSLFRRSRY